MSGLLQDRVDIWSADGQRHSSIEASVQGTRIYVMRADIPIRPGDKVTRKLPSGLTETYIVEDPGFHAAMGGIPGSYQMHVRRTDAVRRTGGDTSVVYNVTGDNARLNVNSIDTSTNVVRRTPPELFDALREAIRGGLRDETLRTALLAKTDELESKTGQDGFLPAYREFISLAADHMSILAPLIPALTQLLSGL